MRAIESRVKEVLEYMKENAYLEYSTGAPSKYSFKTFCRENNISMEGSRDKGNITIISCPFHSDSTPSCSLNHEHWMYNCFACKGGNFLNFRHRYLTEILGKPVSWYGMLEQMLKEDRVMQATLGFSTIYQKEKQSIEEIKPIVTKRFHGVRRLPASYLEMVPKFKKLNPSIEQKVMFVLMLQNGVSAEDAYAEFFGSKGVCKSDTSEPLGSEVTEDASEEDRAKANVQVSSAFGTGTGYKYDITQFDL